MKVFLSALIVACLALVLRAADAGSVRVSDDDSVIVETARGAGEFVFRPAFIALHSAKPLATASVKWAHPVYNLVGWKDADGKVVR